MFPTSSLASCCTEPLRLALATWEANSSATPTDRPRTASSSCTSTSLTFSRTRYRWAMLDSRMRRLPIR